MELNNRADYETYDRYVDRYQVALSSYNHGRRRIQDVLLGANGLTYRMGVGSVCCNYNVRNINWGGP